MDDDDYNFNFGPQDFDVDAEILSPDAEEDTTFVLRPRDAQPAAKQKKTTSIPPSASKEARLSMLNMDTQQSKALPRLASPAAEGWGPTVALPTLLVMGQAAQQDMEESTDLLDTSVFSMRALSIVEGMQDWQPPISPTSPTPPTSPEPQAGQGKEMPPSIAKIFPKLPRATVAGQEPQRLQFGGEQGRESQTTPQDSGGGSVGSGGDRAPKPDLASYQFPVDDDADSGPPPPPPPSTPPPGSKPRKPSPILSRKPPGPALKKSPQGSTVSGLSALNTS